PRQDRQACNRRGGVGHRAAQKRREPAGELPSVTLRDCERVVFEFACQVRLVTTQREPQPRDTRREAEREDSARGRRQWADDVERPSGGGLRGDGREVLGGGAVLVAQAERAASPHLVEDLGKRGPLPKARADRDGLLV